jgi:hypothetical protein
LNSIIPSLFNIQKDWTGYGLRPRPGLNHWNVPAKVSGDNENGRSAKTVKIWLGQIATPLQKWSKQTILPFRQKHIGAHGDIVQEIANLADPTGS